MARKAAKVDLRAPVTSASNPAVKAARKLARGQRRGGSAFLVEGPQAVREGLAHLTRLFVTEAGAAREPELVSAAEDLGLDVVPVSDPVLASLAGTVTPQGLIGVGELPTPDLADALDGASLVVVCWEVRDPGNLGTIIRTADAAGADAVVLAGDSVDPRNGKAVRASAGSLFHLPVAIEPSWAEVARACRARGLQLVAADGAGEVVHTDLDLGRPTAVVFGNEARGLDPDVLADCDVVARVPIAGRAESLNLAATVAVITYEAARQRAARPSAALREVRT
jgi:RNA methyltransferase, TrmH family